MWVHYTENGAGQRTRCRDAREAASYVLTLLTEFKGKVGGIQVDGKPIELMPDGWIKTTLETGELPVEI